MHLYKRIYLFIFFNLIMRYSRRYNFIIFRNSNILFRFRQRGGNLRIVFSNNNFILNFCGSLIIRYRFFYFFTISGSPR